MIQPRELEKCCVHIEMPSKVAGVMSVFPFCSISTEYLINSEVILGVIPKFKNHPTAYLMYTYHL